MIINHHPSDAMLMSYASSALSNGFSLMVSCHLEGCQPCQEELQTMEMIGGAFLNQGSSAPLEVHSLETALDRISEPEETPALVSHQQSANEQDPDFPVSLAPYLDGALDALRWQKLVPGIKQIKLDVGDNELPGSVRLFNIKPGFSLPQHSHNGEELSFVLRGAFTDEFGRYGVGDLTEMGPDDQHQPITDTQEPCICLIATDAPLKFKWGMSRFLQPWLGL